MMTHLSCFADIANIHVYFVLMFVLVWVQCEKKGYLRERRRNIRFTDEPIFISPALRPLQHILLVPLPQSGIHTFHCIFPPEVGTFV